MNPSRWTRSHGEARAHTHPGHPLCHLWPRWAKGQKGAPGLGRLSLGHLSTPPKHSPAQPEPEKKGQDLFSEAPGEGASCQDHRAPGPKTLGPAGQPRAASGGRCRAPGPRRAANSPLAPAVSFQGLPTSSRACWAPAAPERPAGKRPRLGGRPRGAGPILAPLSSTPPKVRTPGPRPGPPSARSVTRDRLQRFRGLGRLFCTVERVEAEGALPRARSALTIWPGDSGPGRAVRGGLRPHEGARASPRGEPRL